MVSTDIPTAYWHWMLDGINHDTGDGWVPLLIETNDGQNCGFVLHRSRRWGSGVQILYLGLAEGYSYVNMVRPLLRALREYAPQVEQIKGRDAVAPDHLGFSLGEAHPFYDALGGLVSRVDPPYAWYVRVPDLPGFLRHIAPALEQRLPGSVAEGFTGELPISLYRGGIRLLWEHGRLVMVEPWQRPDRSETPGASFPPLVFLQLLFGRRSLDELRYAYPDVWADDEIAPVLNTIFPHRYSLAIPLD